MTVSTTANSIQYAGNGVTTSFSFPYVFFASSDLVVTLFIVATAADYAPAPVLNGGATYDYTISGTFDTDLGEYPAGANVVFTTAPPTGYTVVLVRDVPATQDVDLLDNTKFPASTVNGEFDKLTVLAQQAGSATDRSLHLPSSDSLTLLTEIPPSATRASMYLGFDSLGNPTALAAPAGTTTVSAAMAAVIVATPLSAARTAMGVAGVADNNAFTGTNSFTTLRGNLIPSGRLTLTTAVPVLTANVAAAATVFYALYDGNVIPIYDGTGFVLTTFAELSNILANSATGKAGPAAGAASKNYDLFVWNDAGTIRLTRGGAWNSDTVRSAATENDLVRTLGILTNLNAITNGPAATRGTYVGTIRTDSGGATVSWHRGAASSGGTAATLNVWNAYNRIDVRGLIGDTTDSYNYTSSTIRAAGGNPTMRVSFVVGLQEDAFSAIYYSMASTAGGGTARAGVGLDVTTAFTGRLAASGATVNYLGQGGTSQQLLGFHFMSACEQGDNVNATTFYGDNGGTVQFSGLEYQGRF